MCFLLLLFLKIHYNAQLNIFSVDNIFRIRNTGIRWFFSCCSSTGLPGAVWTTRHPWEWTTLHLPGQQSGSPSFLWHGDGRRRVDGMVYLCTLCSISSMFARCAFTRYNYTFSLNLHARFAETVHKFAWCKVTSAEYKDILAQYKNV